MSRLTPDQLRTRQRIESLITLASPALNLVLAAGERLARLVEPEDYEYLPPRRAETQPGPAEPRPGSVPRERS